MSRSARSIRENHCAVPLRKHLELSAPKLEPEDAAIRARPKGKKSGQNAPSFDLRTEVVSICGNRLTTSQWNGCSDCRDRPNRGRRVLDASSTEKPFTTWSGWYPTNEQTGGKIGAPANLESTRPPCLPQRPSLLRSQSYLGAQQYGRLRTRFGAPKAIAAMACRLACLFDWLVYHEQP